LEEKEVALKEEYEKKFDEYKDDITTKFSNFVDSVLDEEMIIPENIKKFAHLGEVYEELIEQFKVRLAIDEGMISEEVKTMLREAKEEIETLRGKVDEMKGHTLELEKDASKMAAHIYTRRKCDGLTEAQKKHVINLLDGVIVKEEIDRKFDIIIESLNIKLDEEEEVKKEEKEEVKEEGKIMEMECPECGVKATVKEGDDVTCKECGATMKVVKEQDGKGNAEVKEEEKVDESKTTPFESWNQLWVNMIRGN